MSQTDSVFQNLGKCVKSSEIVTETATSEVVIHMQSGFYTFLEKISKHLSQENA